MNASTAMSETMLPIPWIDVLLIFALIAMNGLLSMSELAIVSARDARLKAMAKDGNKGAATALALLAEPGRFFSTVQIGITLIGILAGAYSGASLGEPVAQRIAALGIGEEWSMKLGFGIVIMLATYASLVIGELVPKQIALRNPERIASLISRPMALLSRLTAPLVSLLDRTSALVLRLMNLGRTPGSVVTAEELHMVVAEAQTAGVLEESERAIISGIVRLADRPVREVMTPRTDIDWIDGNSSIQEIRETLEETPHSRLPVANGSVDEIVGVVSAREMLIALLDGKALDIAALAKPAPIIPDLMDAMDALNVLRVAEVPLALVHDEYGHLDGIVTPGSILAALAGHFRNDEEEGDPLVERQDGSFLVSGAAAADLVAERLGFDLPDDRDYATVAGFALSVLRRIPEEGERFQHGGWTFEVVDMDSRKIDKMIAMKIRKKRRKAEAPSA